TVTTNQVTRPGIAPITFDGQIEIILYSAQELSAQSQAVVNVQSAAASTRNTRIEVGGGAHVTVGLNGRLDTIAGQVQINNSSSPHPPLVTIDDSGDTTGHVATISRSDSVTDSITGLAAPILVQVNASPGAMNVEILGGSGGNTFNVEGTVA